MGNKGKNSNKSTNKPSTSTPKTPPPPAVNHGPPTTPRDLTPINMGEHFEASIINFQQNVKLNPLHEDTSTRLTVIPPLDVLHGLQTVNQMNLTVERMHNILQQLRQIPKEGLSDEHKEVQIKGIMSSIGMKRPKSMSWMAIYATLIQSVSLREFCENVDKLLTRQIRTFNRSEATSSTNATDSTDQAQADSSHYANDTLNDSLLNTQLDNVTPTVQARAQTPPPQLEDCVDNVVNDLKQDVLDHTLTVLKQKTEVISKKNNIDIGSGTETNVHPVTTVDVEINEHLSRDFQNLEVNAVRQTKNIAQSSGLSNITDDVPPLTEAKIDFFSFSPKRDLKDILAAPISPTFMHQHQAHRGLVLGFLSNPIAYKYCCQGTDDSALRSQLDRMVTEYQLSVDDLHDDYVFTMAIQSDLTNGVNHFFKSLVTRELAVKVCIASTIKCFLAIATYLRMHTLTMHEFIAIHETIIKVIHRVHPMVARHLANYVMTPSKEQTHFISSLMFHALESKSILMLSGYAMMIRTASHIQIEILNSLSDTNIRVTSELMDRVDRSNNYSQSLIGQLFNLIANMNASINAINKTIKSEEAKYNMQAGTKPNTTHQVPNHFNKTQSNASSTKSRQPTIQMYMDMNLKVGYWFGVPLVVDDRKEIQISVDATRFLRQIGSIETTHETITFLSQLEGPVLQKFGCFKNTKFYDKYWEMHESFDRRRPAKDLLRAFFNEVYKHYKAKGQDVDVCFGSEWKLILLTEFLKQD